MSGAVSLCCRVDGVLGWCTPAGRASKWRQRSRFRFPKYVVSVQGLPRVSLATSEASRQRGRQVQPPSAVNNVIALGGVASRVGGRAQWAAGGRWRIIGRAQHKPSMRLQALERVPEPLAERASAPIRFRITDAAPVKAGHARVAAADCDPATSPRFGDAPCIGSPEPVVETRSCTWRR